MTSISPSNFSVTLNPASSNQLWGVGGTVIYPLVGAPLPTGQSLLIKRVLPLTQQISTQNQGNYYAQVTEQALDTLEMQIQQVSTRTSQIRGIWASGIVYNIGDIVQDGAAGNNTNNYYICVTANTSSVWATDLAAGDWSISSFASVPTGNLTLTGDVTGSGTTPIATTLSTVNSNVGSFTNANITVDAKGRITTAANGSAGTGTVTSVTYTGDGILQSSTPTSAVTSSGTLTAAVLTQPKNTVLAGPTSGSNAAPTFRALVAADIPSAVYPTKGTALTVNPYAQNIHTSAAHSLGATPTFIVGYIECLSTEQNYNIGDRIYSGSGLGGAYNTAPGITFSGDSTNVYINTEGDTNPFILNKSSNALVQITPAKWKIIAVPYL